MSRWVSKAPLVSATERLRPFFTVSTRIRTDVGSRGNGEGNDQELVDADVELLADDLQDVVEGDDRSGHQGEGIEAQSSQEDVACEEGVDPIPRPSPSRPEQAEVDTHFAAGHVPRRIWCPICAQAALDEDPHRRGP